MYRRQRPIDKLCLRCHSPLATSHHGARYCSPRCKQADYRDRQRGDKYGGTRVLVKDLHDLAEALARVENHPALAGYEARRLGLLPVRTLVRHARQKLDELENEAILKALRAD